MNKICIYAICKDEIKFVDKWLDSMSEADYIVVLDTGSTDGTYERLKADPRVTKVEQKVIKPWRFDVARNESLKLVPEDANILFSTDLDELLEPGWGDLIRNNWTENTWRGHYRYVWSHDEQGNPGDTFWYDKMHIRSYEWKYPVHEVLMPPGGENVIFTTEKEHLIDFGNSITLHHYPDESKSRSSYLDLLKIRVDENPEEAYSWFLLGREYGHLNMVQDAIETLSHTLELPDVETKTLVKYCTLGYLGDLHVVLNNYDVAMMYYNKQLLVDKTYREPYFNLAELYSTTGFYKIAISFIEEGFKNSYQHFDWTERSKAWSYQPYDILSICYYFLDQTDLGIENAVRALKLCPFDTRIQKNYLALLDKKK